MWPLGLSCPVFHPALPVACTSQAAVPAWWSPPLPASCSCLREPALRALLLDAPGGLLQPPGRSSRGLPPAPCFPLASVPVCLLDRTGRGPAEGWAGARPSVANGCRTSGAQRRLAPRAGLSVAGIPGCPWGLRGLGEKPCRPRTPSLHTEATHTRGLQPCSLAKGKLSPTGQGPLSWAVRSCWCRLVCWATAWRCPTPVPARRTAASPGERLLKSAHLGSDAIERGRRGCLVPPRPVVHPRGQWASPTVHTVGRPRSPSLPGHPRKTPAAAVAA